MNTDYFDYRIDLETGKQTVMSAHGAPVKSVVYSKEHCNFTPLHTHHKILKPPSPPNLLLLGLNPPLPRPIQPHLTTHNHNPPLKTSLPIPHPLKTSSSHVLPPSLHLPILFPLTHRSKTLATTRIIPKIHDTLRILHAQRFRLRHLQHRRPRRSRMVRSLSRISS